MKLFLMFFVFYVNLAMCSNIPSTTAVENYPNESVLNGDFNNVAEDLNSPVDDGINLCVGKYLASYVPPRTCAALAEQAGFFRYCIDTFFHCYGVY